MSGKQKEGDNQRRRARARRARQEGETPSEAGVTLGAAKQREHEESARRDGPVPAGTRKQVPRDPDEGSPPAPAPQWPRHRPRPAEAEPGVHYRELVAGVGASTGLDFDTARLACQATVTVLLRCLGDEARERVLRRVPAELHDDYPGSGCAHPGERGACSPPPNPGSGCARPGERGDLAGFVDQVATIVRRPPDQARYQAQAALSAMRDQDPDLIDSIGVPDYLGDLLTPPPTGGGLVSATGGTPPLTGNELRAALAALPLWSGDHYALVRTLALPPGNMDRVLSRMEGLKRELGRGPRIARDGDGSATLTVRTTSAGAVTALDVELAHRVDAAVEEAGAGMDTPGRR
jgi:hypothetical protein